MFRPFAYRTLYLVPFQAGGKTGSGIEIFHHEKLPPVYGRVTLAHPTCRNVRSGDWIVYLPNRPARIKTLLGPLYCLSELDVLGIVEPGDGLPWFAPAA